MNRGIDVVSIGSNRNRREWQAGFRSRSGPDWRWPPMRRADRYRLRQRIVRRVVAGWRSGV